MLLQSLEGQATELGWVRDNDLTVGADDYLRLVLKKTAWYSFIHPMRIGALVADGDNQNLSRFDRFGYLLGGAAITETVFNWPGVGLQLYRAIGSRDYAFIQGAVLLVATIFVVVNLMVDLMYAVVDPRIRYR